MCKNQDKVVGKRSVAHVNDNGHRRKQSATKSIDSSLEHVRKESQNRNPPLFAENDGTRATFTVSEFSHQQLAPQPVKEEDAEKEDEWQTMPSYAPFDIYNDDNKLVAREHVEDDDEAIAYAGLGGAGKGYTRVQIDEDAQSATSMDDQTAYLFTRHQTTDLLDDDEEARDPLAQMEATKDLLTEGQRIAYVGLVRLAMIAMEKDLSNMERTRATKKIIDIAVESLKMWSQKMMVRLYSHMEIDSSEQIMIEQLAEHGVEAGDLTPSLMINARVKNPVVEEEKGDSSVAGTCNPSDDVASAQSALPKLSHPLADSEDDEDEPLPSYDQHKNDELPEVRTLSQLPTTKKLDIDLRWTVLCDLFLVLIADSVYDSRSRELLELVGKSLEVHWLEIYRFEKRVVDALEMQERANKENWNEDEHLISREKRARNRRLAMMGLATVGGGLVIGLSAGLLAPVIGAGLAAGFTTIGISGTSAVLTSTAAAAAITTGATVTGGTIGVRAASRRTGAVKTFEYRPLHNNKRVNLIVTVSGWMNGKVDDVRLPYSTVDPIMGDIYSVLWEPEMLRSMGDTINILATEALTQGLQQILGSTILVALMASLQAPIVLTKLSYLIDNPWSVSVARSDAAGLILADSLIDRNLGIRPITLVGFSIGSRVIFSALKELANKGAYGLVQNVFLFGSPVIAKKDEYLKAKSVVSGRFVNGYATNDWILGYLFRATGGGIMRVAGLAPVDIPGIENIDVTQFVPGHMSYRTAMPKLLREVGFLVESDEFTEIEDPDPENHEQRQRELINEIEEARKNFEKKPQKKGFWSFRSKKKLEKKDWEMYEDKNVPVDSEARSGPSDHGGLVLFDIEAIQREVAELAADGVEIREIESTLPPMKIDMNEPRTLPAKALILQETKSHTDSIGMNNEAASSAPNLADKRNTTPPKPSQYDYVESEHTEQSFAKTFDMSYTASSKHSGLSPPVLGMNTPSGENLPTLKPSGERPPLKTIKTTPAAVSLDHNAWADEDDFAESEISMTFE
ncbi:DUF726-domain-containing protein [Pseudovirgaria hyperparasitica]|uniref:DUF726-domain-containing protein n=1 Tax=Pseudovirgaria hyperparasitica TaxID=470096 RepID=A0A6A6VUG6_9PEZI|nr:DUF726-domain-containing protein [Pseudovirgaria hyperparasitica]KAF2753260.1 DUF726-domain-containing protein [Pseudovirgaria hyperparasitica]